MEDVDVGWIRKGIGLALGWHFVWLARGVAVKRAAYSEVNARTERKVLEVGASGKGYLLVPMLRVTTPQKTLCDLKPLPEEGIESCDLAEKLPYDDREFDLVMVSNTLEHVPPDRVVPALKEMARVGRKVIVVLPHPLSFGDYYLVFDHQSVIYVTGKGGDRVLHVRNNPFYRPKGPHHAESVHLDPEVFDVRA